jgi:amino acid permease
MKTNIKILLIILFIIILFILIVGYFAWQDGFFEPKQISDLCSYTLNISNIAK